MFFSIRPFFTQKNDIKKNSKGIIISLLINYVLLSGAYLLFASLFFPTSSDYFIGYVLLAIVPPAVSIVPLCYLTKCDMKIADTALVIGYFMALIIIPTTVYLMFGSGINFLILIRSLTTIILLPIFLAYVTRNVHSKIFDYTKIINNILIGLIVFMVVSVNRKTLLNVTDTNIITIFIINILIIFILGLGVYYISKRYVADNDAIDYSLYATQKNEATGLTIALLMFSANTAIPLIIALVLQFVYFMIFERFIINPTSVDNNSNKDSNNDSNNDNTGFVTTDASATAAPIDHKE
ncbi:MAG: hypothetical protein ACP5N1_01480 [Candidatus Woesearchaeota archaeon]